MHLVMPGYIGNFYIMQVALTCAQSSKIATANLSTQIHQDIRLWRILRVKITTRPINSPRLSTRMRPK